MAKQLKKDITFIYSDMPEKEIYKALLVEAEKRGYTARLSDDPLVKCEIGVYCQHINFPENSRFSVIMLHDIIQQYSNWPDIWYLEPWNKYDIGILPSAQWVKNWRAASGAFYTRPRQAMVKVGWPKADSLVVDDSVAYRRAFNAKYGLKDEWRTVLYAPSWENDGKQDDFVQAMLGLNVNILIKQWGGPKDKFPEISANIEAMKKLHEGIEGVTILPTSMNIFEAIAAADMLVSDESSTMVETVMMGKPAVSVSDWLVPDGDGTPYRYPQCNYSFVNMTTKAELASCVQGILADYDTYRAKAKEYRDENFANIGRSSTMVMDIIDDCVAGKPVRYENILPNEKKRVGLLRYLKFKYLCFRRRVYYVYVKKCGLVAFVWNCLKTVRHALAK